MILISAHSYLAPILTTPVPSYRYNEPAVSTVVHPGDNLLIIVSNSPFVVQGHVYYFQLKAFDGNQVTKTTPLD